MSAEPVDPVRLDHRGVLYTDRAALVALAVPLITDALTGGEGVVVVVDRATARELDDALVDGTRVTFPPPSALSGHGSDAFTTSLAGWAATGPVFVLSHYRPGHAPGPAVDPSLAELPITLICACAHDAGPEVLGAFHHQHDVLVPAGPGVDDREAAPLETAVAGSDDLAGLRRDVRRAATAAGFRGHALDRAVLAVHEAAIVGYRHLPDEPGPAVATPEPEHRCRLRIRTGSGRLAVDVVVPGPPGGDGGPGDERGTDLGPVRPFCHTVSVHDSTSSRSIRVLALVGD